ncbi:MAG: M48 family metallopeptidase [Bdellovibrionota bacterium]
MIKKYFLVIVLFLTACASTTEEGSVGVGRKQLMLMPAEQIEAEAAKGYEQIKSDAKAKRILNVNAAQVLRVQTIANRLTPLTGTFRGDALKWNWEVNVITSKELNAWCMPGGKMMFYTGIIEQLKLTDAEIAAIMGHEIAHALREHGRERYSQEMAKQIGASLLVMSGLVDEKYVKLGLVATVFLALKYGRDQESEADTLGLELMARAGFNPEEAVTLWQKMGVASGGSKSPDWLSTHPSGDKRINDITALLPRVIPLYQAAKK